ncbi:MAG: hypothetical protein P4M14_12880 [Gammaproteobacteria bacterium]|nr:hypothetical protein [Gammaproteobacteria bacterium]
MAVQRQQVARLQSDFYRDSYHKLLRFVIFEIFIMLLLISAIVYFVVFQPLSHYYATTTTGLVIPLTPAK